VLGLLSLMGCVVWLWAGWQVVGTGAAVGTAIALCFFTRCSWGFFQTKREHGAATEAREKNGKGSQSKLPAQTLAAARVGLWSWDLVTDKMEFSDSWLRAVGDDPEDASSDPGEWLNRIHPNYVGEVRKAIADHLDGHTDAIECDYRFRARHGGYVWVLNRAAVERGADGKPKRLAGCQIDITSMVDVEKRVLHDAYADRLTGLPNRRAFMPVLERACEQARNGADAFALLFLDLDRFKQVNDTFGHAVGDELLAAAAKRLEEQKGSNGFVARLGGDEFIFLLPGLDSEEEALSKARQIYDGLSRPYELAGREVQSGASVGVAIGGKSSRCTAEQMMRDADQAMYQAKSAKKGVAMFSATMRTRASQTQTLQLELAGAAERAELELHFQPIVCLRRGVVTGAEALLRWKRPDGGCMAAAEFVPLAEDAGLLASIGEWAIRAACVYRRGWLKQGFGEFCVSVNVAASQLQREDFAERVIRILRRTELPPDLLQIEIDETSLGPSNGNAARNLQMLTSHGVRLAVGAFGSGEASLSRLTSVPLHAIKLDRQFLADVDSNASKQSIVRGVVSLAHAIKLRVAAEGIETAAMLRQVEAERCDMAQGFYLSKPVPAVNLSKILRVTEEHAARRAALEPSAS
jgi:diguanylate cyclase (GGDEF)-like protein